MRTSLAESRILTLTSASSMLVVLTMKRYSDNKKDKSKPDLTKSELKEIQWTKYKIIVPTESDKEELEAAFEHIHYSDIDTDIIAVNQLAHEYLTPDKMDGAFNNIIVNESLFKKLNKR